MCFTALLLDYILTVKGLKRACGEFLAAWQPGANVSNSPSGLFRGFVVIKSLPSWAHWVRLRVIISSTLHHPLINHHPPPPPQSWFWVFFFFFVSLIVHFSPPPLRMYRRWHAGGRCRSCRHPYFQCTLAGLVHGGGGGASFISFENRSNFLAYLILIDILLWLPPSHVAVDAQQGPAIGPAYCVVLWTLSLFWCIPVFFLLME